MASQDRAFVKRHKIKSILNMTHDLPCHFHGGGGRERAIRGGIEYAIVPVDDSLKTKDYKIMEKALPFAVAFLHRNVDIEKNPTLVHCFAGAQRSATAVAAYLMTHRPDIAPSYEKAVKYVYSRRPAAWHEGEHVNFHQALRAYAKSHTKASVGAVSAGYTGGTTHNAPVKK